MTKPKTTKKQRFVKRPEKTPPPQKGKNTGKKLGEDQIFTISINSKGVGFVSFDEDEEDIQIESEYLNCALNNDEVKISLLSKKDYGRKFAKVEEIVERNKTLFVGTLHKKDGTYFVVPDDNKVYVDIIIKENKLNKAEVGQKVQISLNEWNNSRDNPTGEIKLIIGEKGDNSAEIHSIVLEKGFEIDFPEDVIREANKIKENAKLDLEQELKTRNDIREKLTITIDPFDAKDFDDAISFMEIDEKTVEIGVHIADVSHFVRPETPLDKEALKRATSVYLVDRTIPMLPEVLSNDLCSLNPNEDKLAFSAIFTIDKNTSNVKSRWFGKTVINSNKRFTYEEAETGIKKGTGEFAKELSTLNSIAKILQKKTLEEGAIDFDQEEVKFRLDPKGVPIEVYKKEKLESHKLVEEFMLLANREVAKAIFEASKNKKGLIGLYRIHNQPEAEKIQNLSLFLKALGHTLPIEKGKINSRDINILLKKITGSAEEALIKTATIRSMAKAIYSPTNSGHFGLAFTYYTHFTSPIRRYPDLVVHRILESHLKDLKINPDEFARIHKIAEKCSEKEIHASEAERASIKMKQVEYMSKKIGEIFSGSISGVTEWGIYVEEENTKCEGMIRLKDIPGDYYNLDQKNYRIVGEKTKKTYSLGDKLKFKVLKADIERKTLDYGLVK